MGTPRTAGALIRRRRLGLGLSQREAAQLCGIPQSRLSRLEAGRTQPSVETLRHLLEGLGAELHLELAPMRTTETGRREKERSLWLNRAVLGELSRDLDRALAIARENIDRWRGVHAGRAAIVEALDRWSEILDEGVDAVVEALTGRFEEAEDLRQNSPFAGVLTQEQREQALAAFRLYWARRESTAATSAPVHAEVAR